MGEMSVAITFRPPDDEPDAVIFRASCAKGGGVLYDPAEGGRNAKEAEVAGIL